MKLYTSPKSGNGYKVELFLNLLGLDFERIYVKVDYASNSHKTAEFLAINPRGQVPAMVDGELNLWESQSILVYVARKYGAESWLPQDSAGLAETIRWLSFSAAEVDGLAAARRIRLFGRDDDLTPHQEYGIGGLKLIDAQLANHLFLAGDHPTIADLACYPYVAMAGEGEIDLAPYKNIHAWMKRIESMDGYIPLP